MATTIHTPGIAAGNQANSADFLSKLPDFSLDNYTAMI